MGEKVDMLLDGNIQRNGTTLYITVGGRGKDCECTRDNPYSGGYNGGGNSVGSGNSYEGGGGGGATSIQTSLIGDGQLKNYKNNRDNVLIVAGGGGGAYTAGGWISGEYIDAFNSGADGGGDSGGANSYTRYVADKKEYNAGNKATQTEGFAFGQGDNCAGGGWYGGYLSLIHI